MIEIDWQTIYYVLSWVIYGAFGFLLAFIQEVMKGKQKITDPQTGEPIKIPIWQLPKDARQQFFTQCINAAGKWFFISFGTAFMTWITMFKAGTLPDYFSQTGILLISGLIFCEVFPKELWNWILSWLKPIWDYLKTSSIKRHEAKLAKLKAKEAELNSELDILDKPT